MHRYGSNWKKKIAMKRDLHKCSGSFSRSQTHLIPLRGFDIRRWSNWIAVSRSLYQSCVQNRRDCPASRFLGDVFEFPFSNSGSTMKHTGTKLWYHMDPKVFNAVYQDADLAVIPRRIHGILRFFVSMRISTLSGHFAYFAKMHVVLSLSFSPSASRQEDSKAYWALSCPIPRNPRGESYLVGSIENLRSFERRAEHEVVI